MSISSPLPSTTFSSKPLQLTFSLDRVVAPPRLATPSSRSTSSTSTSRSRPSNSRQEDIFDELDQLKIARGWNGTLKDKSRRNPRLSTSKVDPPRAGALTDAVGRLYPNADLELEEELAGYVQGEGISWELPNWLRDASSRVNSIAVGELGTIGTGEQEGTNETLGKTKRVAVGTEDGTVWIFQERGIDAQRNAGRRRTRHDRDATVVPAKRSQHSPTDSRAHSPVPHPASSSFSSAPASVSGPSPRLSTRRSSASLSTLSSFASHQSSSTTAARNVSGASRPPSLSGTSTSTYSELRSPPDQQRLRKASATVSISTTSVTPSPAHHHHSHSHSSSLSNPETNLGESSSFVSLPSLSPVETRSTPTYPLSPVPNRPPPQFRFSPSNDLTSTSSRTSPSPPPARKPPPQTSIGGGLASKKEARQYQQQQQPKLAVSEATGGSNSPNGSNSGHRSRSRGVRDSITNGIGLWETSGTPDLGELIQPGSEQQNAGLGIVNGEEAPREESGLMSRLSSSPDFEGLEPVLKVLTTGFGSVVGMETITHPKTTSSRSVDVGPVLQDELIVLRQSGHLSIVSLADGRCLASCQASTDVKGDFRRLRIVERDQTRPLAICIADVDTSVVVCIDLETLSVAQVIQGVDSMTVTSHSQSARMLYLSSGSNELRCRSISASSSSTPISEDSSSLGTVESWSQVRGLETNGKYVVAWDETGLSIASIEGNQVSQVALIPLIGVRSVAFLRDDDRESFLVSSSSGLAEYRIEVRSGHREVKLERQYETKMVEALCFSSQTESTDKPQVIVFARKEEDRIRSLNQLELQASCISRNVYRSESIATLEPRVTRTRKVGPDSTLLAFSNGVISIGLNSLLGSQFPSFDVNAQLDGAISVLDVIELGGREIVIAGSVNGSIGIWNLSNWEEIAALTLFASPVLSHARVSLPSHPHALLFVSCNSPISLVSLHPPQLLFTLPGTRSAVQLVATTRQGEVMILYKHGLARVWDAETGELRRSMERKTAEGVLTEKDKGWIISFDIEVENAGAASSSMIHPSMTFDLRTTLEDASRDLPWSGSKQRAQKKLLNGFDSLDATPDVSRSASPAHFGNSSSISSDQVEVVKTWLSYLVPFGVDADCDETLEQLGIVESPLHLALASQQPGFLAFSAGTTLENAWTTSPHATAQRLLAITCLLRIFLNYPSTERAAGQAIVYFASCLDAAVGIGFERPSLELFADYWLDKNPEVQQGAKTLFGTYLASLSTDETLALVHEWQDHLPARRNAQSRDSNAKSNTAVSLIGLIAVDRFKLLPASVLTDLSISVASYLEDNLEPIHQAIATELCSRGFHIWQNYVDAMALVRQLFSIAIGRNPSTPSDLRALARQATVHVAGINSPLFMSTLLYDILNAPTAQSRNATLKLLGFMIRKKPLVLYHSLPRVVEAVVKSLDPTISDLRETVHQTATVILNELVKTFPSIDFHGKSQRLAVGTQEGSAIVYDLKTATRLYVLEGHRRPLTAVSWSPDGHRLTTVSLDESKVCVWKTGMGILSLIGAPTQRAGSPPLREWDFHVGDEALMTTAATLEWIVLDWPADRTVRLRIRETALSFGA